MLKLWIFGIVYNSAALSSSMKKEIHILHFLDSWFPFILDLPVFYRQNSFQNESCKNLHISFIRKLCKTYTQMKGLNVTFHSVLQLLNALKWYFDIQAILSTMDFSFSCLPAHLRFLFWVEGSNSRNCGTCVYLLQLGAILMGSWSFFLFVYCPWFWYPTANVRNLSAGPFRNLQVIIVEY